MTMLERVEEYREDLELFETANEKMDYIVDLGKNFDELDESLKTDVNLVHGCASKAWMIKDFQDGKVIIKADGESIMAHGMITILLSIFSNRTPDEILEFDPSSLEQLHFEDLLTPVRIQGMQAFLNYIYGYAKECKEK